MTGDERGACVVFDLDGVIVASEHLWEEGWRRVSRAQGREWLEADTRECQGKSVPEWAHYLADRSGLTPPQARDAVVAYVMDAYDNGEVPLLPHAAELVQGVSRRVPVGLATSAPREVIDRVVARPELAGCFTATVSSAEVARGKPSPDVYLAALEQLNGDPSRSFAVEDSSNGIRAAAAAGLRVIGIENPQYPVAEDAARLATVILRSLLDVADRLFADLDREPAS